MSLKKALNSLRQSSNDPHLSDEEKVRYQKLITETENQIMKLRDNPGGSFEVKKMRKEDPF